MTSLSSSSSSAVFSVVAVVVLAVVAVVNCGLGLKKLCLTVGFGAGVVVVLASLAAFCLLARKGCNLLVENRESFLDGFLVSTSCVVVRMVVVSGSSVVDGAKVDVMTWMASVMALVKEKDSETDWSTETLTSQSP